MVAVNEENVSPAGQASEVHCIEAVTPDSLTGCQQSLLFGQSLVARPTLGLWTVAVSRHGDGRAASDAAGWGWSLGCY